MEPFTYTRTIVKPDGGSDFETATIDLERSGAQRAISSVQAATAISFRWTPGDYAWAPHTAPRRRWVVMLDGTLEVLVTSGEARRFTAGDVLEVGDISGHGHVSRAVDGQPFRSAFINLDDTLVRGEPGAPESDASAPAGPLAVQTFATSALADGASRNAVNDLPYMVMSRSGRVSDELPITGFEIAWASGDLDSGWHTTGRRQIVIPLSGGMDVEASAGPRLSIPPGGVYFSEDLTGTGHRTRAISGQPRLAIFAHLT